MKGIPTVYRGIEYRSQLEARWAAIFDLIGWHHTFEAIDSQGYIPDFRIHGPQPMLVEIKPAVTEDDYWSPIDKVTTVLDGHWDHDILILGADPLPQLGDSDGREWRDRYPSAGLLGEILTERWEYTIRNNGRFVECEPYWGFGIGRWLTSVRYGKIGVFRNIEDAYTSHPSGHYFDSLGYLGALDPRTIRGFWAAHATNFVKWQGMSR